jgi:uncharacterized protein YbbC (DUF1343 family)
MLCGLDQLAGQELGALRRRLRGARLGVLTHAGAIDRHGRQTLRVLEELGASPAVVFAPEHGLESAAQAEEPVASSELVQSDGSDPAPMPVISLYGADRPSLSPQSEALERIDVLLVDLADVGSRYYTYVWTALLAARAAAAAGRHTVILDRPNPLGADPALLEGAPQQPGFLSFVGLEPLPIRHCMTLAEVVTLFWERDGGSLGPDGGLSVVPTLGWERFRGAEAWGRPFVMPSPNMPTLETAQVYPGGCLIEGTNLSEGRGTTAPFQLVGAPFLDGRRLAASLSEAGVPGALIRPVTFRPVFGKYANEVCRGVMIHVQRPALFRPVAAYLTLIALARDQAPEQFAFRTEPYEFEPLIPAFDLLTGSAVARSLLEQGASAERLVAELCPVDAGWRDTVESGESRLARAHA